MKYLIRKKGEKKAAHIWTGTDTSCRMWSTGGLNRVTKKWLLADDTQGLEVCTMCRNNQKKGDAASAQFSAAAKDQEKEIRREEWRQRLAFGHSLVRGNDRR